MINELNELPAKKETLVWMSDFTIHLAEFH